MLRRWESKGNGLQRGRSIPGRILMSVVTLQYLQAAEAVNCAGTGSISMMTINNFSRAGKELRFWRAENP